MKSRILACMLFISTAAIIAFAPFDTSKGALSSTPGPGASGNAKPVVEVVFVLDTTGSMSGMIQTAKEKIWSIASSMAQAQPSPEIRMGLVAYRDRGDAYVTRVVNLSTDLDSLYASLMDLRADGGGDGPESVNQALNDALHKIGWSQNSNVYKVVFLVGDAPPHKDYRDDIQYPSLMNEAKARGIVVNTVQCGTDGDATREWRQIASLGTGRYFQVEQAGGAIAMNTPFDAEMANLSAQLDATRVYYGTPEARLEKEAKIAATEKLRSLSTASQARRAAFNTSPSGTSNLAGTGELIDDLKSGRVKLDEVKREQLPRQFDVMSPAETQSALADLTRQRSELVDKLKSLTEQRNAYMTKKLEREGGGKDSLDQKIYEAVKEQGSAKGLSYTKAAPTY